MKNVSVVSISYGRRRSGEGAQTRFWCDVSGRFGGGYVGANAGKDEDSAVAFAIREMIRYGFHRPGGAVIVGPPAIESRVREALEASALRDGRQLQSAALAFEKYANRIAVEY